MAARARRPRSPEVARPSIFWLLAAIAAGPVTALFKYDIRGELPRTGPFILTPNHYSDIDPVVMGWAVWRLGRAPRFMAKASLFRIPVIGRLLHWSGQIPVERERGKAKQAALSAAEHLVETGRGVIVYPEGTLTREPAGWPMRGKSGAVRIALAEDIPVIPIASWGADAVVPRFQRKLRLRWRAPITIRVGEPIDLSAYRGRAHSRTAIEEATTIVMREITALLEEIRGETAPAELYDPVKHSQTEFGMPVATVPAAEPVAAPSAETVEAPAAEPVEAPDPSTPATASEPDETARA